MTKTPIENLIWKLQVTQSQLDGPVRTKTKADKRKSVSVRLLPKPRKAFGARQS